VVERLLLGYLGRPDVVAALSEQRSSSNLASIRSDVKADEQQLRELAGLWASRSVTTAEYLAARKQIEKRLGSLQTLMRVALPGAVRSLLTAKDVTTAWERLEPRQRQEVAHVVFPNGVRVDPSTKNRFLGFDSERLVPVDWQS
jgi:hypothetical protein